METFRTRKLRLHNEHFEPRLNKRGYIKPNYIHKTVDKEVLKNKKKIIYDPKEDKNLYVYPKLRVESRSKKREIF